MYFTVSLIIFLILSFRVTKYNKKAYDSFIAESAPDQKEVEIDLFWKRVKSASTRPMKEEIIFAQSLFWFYYQKALKRKYIAFTVLIVGILVEWYLY